MATTLLMNLGKLNITQSLFLPLKSAQIHTQCCPLLFRQSQQLWAEPMKKKKKVDPAIVAARKAKKIKKIEKEIKKLTKLGKILKPVEEFEMDSRKLALARERKRENPGPTLEQDEARHLLQKEWTAYKTRRWFHQYQVHHQMVSAQQEALEELKAESHDLYLAAIQLDTSLLPLESMGPKLTPPVEVYLGPNGDYVDTTRKY